MRESNDATNETVERIAQAQGLSARTFSKALVHIQPASGVS
jgi:hypothetical protein